MAFETVHLLKWVEFEIDTDGTYTFELKTDQPGDAMAVRMTRDFNTEDTTTGRRTVRLRCPGSCKGKLLRAKLWGLVVGKIYAGRVWARPIGGTAGNWEWYPLPIRPTAEPYSVASLPIRPTEEIFKVATLPIRPTEDIFATAKLPSRPTAEEFQRGPLPIPESSLIPNWVRLSVDPIE